MSYKGTDFLVYGLDKEWYLKHPEIQDMKKSEELPFLTANGRLSQIYRLFFTLSSIENYPLCMTDGFDSTNFSPCTRVKFTVSYETALDMA